MKKLTALMLAMTMVLTLFAGCGKSEPEATVPAQEMPASALEILETVWADYADEEKFSIIGGNIEANIMDAPGNYDMTYAENMTWNLLVPEDQIANITEAASMIHMMNANTFTCGAFKLAGGSAADFAAAMQQAIQGNMWMCGFPDSLLIRSFGDTYVVVAFGVNDAMTPFEQHLTAAYPGMETLYSEPINA
ncbi:MAG: hypothetical protein IJE81_00270 [Oscillospiraceae bacterium]|nr:hypothetical protein [Oscillospiraceae bacterium]